MCRAWWQHREPADMSKKNKLSTRRNRHAFDIQNEKAAAEKRTKELEKKQVKLQSQGVEKQSKKNKKIRIRKHVRVKGIVIKDAESKKKARKLLAQDAAQKLMEVDGAPAEIAAQLKKKKRTPTKGSLKIKKAPRKGPKTESMQE